MTWNVKDGVNYTGMTPEGEAILRKQGKWKGDKPSKQVEESPTVDLKSELTGKKMKELQELGETYGVKDNIKLELIDKILTKASDDDIKKFLGVK